MQAGRPKIAPVTSGRESPVEAYGDDTLTVSSDVGPTPMSERELARRRKVRLLVVGTALLSLALGYWFTNRPATDLHPGDYVRTRDRDNFGQFVAYMPDATDNRLAIISLADGERAIIPVADLVIVERKRR